MMIADPVGCDGPQQDCLMRRLFRAAEEPAGPKAPSPVGKMSLKQTDSFSNCSGPFHRAHTRVIKSQKLRTILHYREDRMRGKDSEIACNEQM